MAPMSWFPAGLQLPLADKPGCTPKRQPADQVGCTQAVLMLPIWKNSFAPLFAASVPLGQEDHV